MTAEVAAALTWQVRAGAAVAVVVLLVVAGDVIGRVVTITHEGGHMAIALLTGGSPKHFHLNADDDGAATAFNRPAAPPLVGLGGALLLKEGKAWPLLWTAVALLVLAWVKARDELTSLVVLGLPGRAPRLVREPAHAAPVLAGNAP